MTRNDTRDAVAAKGRSSRTTSGGDPGASATLDTNGGDGEPGPPFAPGEAEAPAPHVPERTCILTRATGDRANLIRLALSPDGAVWPDIRARAPGRGAWIGVDRATLEAAQAKGKLRGALARAFKGKAASVPDDLPARIEEGLRRAFLDRLGLEARAGVLLLGSDRIGEAARSGRVHLLLHAADAGADGNRKLDQAWRVGLDEEGSDRRGVVLPVGRTILAMALGRENVVHVAIVDRAAAGRVHHALGRWRGYIGPDDGASPPGAVFGTAAEAVPVSAEEQELGSR